MVHPSWSARALEHGCEDVEIPTASPSGREANPLFGIRAVWWYHNIRLAQDIFDGATLVAVELTFGGVREFEFLGSLHDRRGMLADVVPWRTYAGVVSETNAALQTVDGECVMLPQFYSKIVRAGKQGFRRLEVSVETVRLVLNRPYRPDRTLAASL